MPTITLPQVGKTPQPATVRRWRKKPGEAVGQGEILLEVEVDEGLAQIESPVAGTMHQLLVEEGTTIPPATPIAVFGEGEAAEVSKGFSAVTERRAMSEARKPPAKPSGNVVPILMPKAGQSMEEGVLLKWHVQPGATITKGQVIFEIETDKANMDVEATDSGRLARIVLKEGESLAVLQPVAYLADNDADVDAFIASQGGAAPVEESRQVTEAPGREAARRPVVAAVVAEGGRVKASPAARKAATERGIDLATVGMGSGPGGRIISTDVPLKPSTAVMAAPAAIPASASAGPGGAVRRKMSKMRKAIAANLSLSKQTIPHFYIRGTIQADALMGFYQGEKAKYPCSINDVVILACARAIRQFAPFRSRIEGDELVELPSVNIGVAVGMDDGLAVPVLVNVDQMSLKQLGLESKRIATAAKSGKIEAAGQGCFTITNMGMLGVEEFSAIVNPPEAAILAVGAVREEVIVSGGTLKPGRVMTMTLSVDHRIIDGMLAARFMARLKELLEWPAQMV